MVKFVEESKRMISLFVVGDRQNVEWVKQLAASSDFSCSFISSVADLPSTYASQRAVYLDTLNGISLFNLSDLIRRGYHLFLNDPFGLTIEELNTLARLAEEAGVYVLPRLPLELKFPSEVGVTPIVGRVSLECNDAPESLAWRGRCLAAISSALSILPFPVKRVRCVSGNKSSNSSIFFGCHLEFENTSLISISISSGAAANSLHVHFFDSTGLYRYEDNDSRVGDIQIKTREDLLTQFVEDCNVSVLRFSVIGLDTISQIMRIYSEIKGQYALA